MTQSTHHSPTLTLVSSPSLRLIDTDLAQRGLNANTRQLYLFLWRAKTQPNRLPLGLVFSERTLAEELHVSVRTIQRALQTLVQQGLLRIQPRVRSNGGTTSNRYILTWHPTAAAKPTVSRTPTTLTTPADGEEACDIQKPEASITPDTVFAWPSVSGGSPTDCRGGRDPQQQTGQAFEGDFEPSIVNQETFSKSDQPVPNSPIWTFNSEDSLQLFLFTLLKTQGVPSQRIRRWIRKYSLQLVTQVAIWLSSAPKGAIHAPGGWMDRALQEGWTAPLWVRQARERRIKAARSALVDQEQTEQEIAEGKRIAANREQEDALWAQIAPRLKQLPELYAYAAQLARTALKSVYPHVFKPGSATERTYVLRAAQERPELMATNFGESA